VIRLKNNIKNFISFKFEINNMAINFGKLFSFNKKKNNISNKEIQTEIKQDSESNNNYYEFENKIISEKDCKKIIKENQKLKSDFKKLSLEYFKTRRTIRKFADQKVPFEIIYDILNGAINCPVAGNIQNFKIILISDEKEKKEIGKIAFQQYWISNASYIIVIVRDNHRLMQLYPTEGETYAVQNCAALIENILMLTHIHDLGACWVGAFNDEVLREYLNVPNDLKIDAIIPIGYPEENPKVEKEVLENLLYFEKYNNKER
jgi:nitroreductase